MQAAILAITFILLLTQTQTQTKLQYILYNVKETSIKAVIAAIMDATFRKHIISQILCYETKNRCKHL